MSELHFIAQRSQHLFKNLHFKRQHPNLAIPKDRDLFDTFQVNYPLYFSDGILAAKEMLEWSSTYLNNDAPHILDWGCGVGRVIQHIPRILPNAICYGADINQQRVKWCRNNINNVLFDCIEDEHIPYPSSLFEVVFGISVLTHIHGSEQIKWVRELHRISTHGAVVLISTHGVFFEHQMNQKEKKQYLLNGFHSNDLDEKGHRLLCTYNNYANFKQLLETYFTIKAFYDGKSHPDKLGGQDLWILRKQ